MTVPEILDELEAFYGPQQPASPTDPYEFLIWWHCGYPASDAACARGWKALQSSIGIAPEQILKASHAALAAALKAGGMVPELRAQRLQQIAERIQQECHGDLLTALAGPPEAARKLLKKFPNIADPGADRILLFANLSPIAAVPSNCPQVLVRYPPRPRTRKLQRHLPRSPGTHRSRSRQGLRRPQARLSSPQAARPATLQAH